MISWPIVIEKPRATPSIFVVPLIYSVVATPRYDILGMCPWQWSHIWRHLADQPVVVLVVKSLDASSCHLYQAGLFVRRPELLVSECFDVVGMFDKHCNVHGEGFAVFAVRSWDASSYHLYPLFVHFHCALDILSSAYLQTNTKKGPK